MKHCIITGKTLYCGFYFVVGKLMDLHGEVSGAKKEGTAEGGEKVDRPEGYEPPVMESV